MEYLPEKRRTQKTQVLKKEQKIREFRGYLADKDIVLSITKCKWESIRTKICFSLVLVALRSQPTWPEDPYSYMVDYFGNERSTAWDTMEELKEENQAIEEEIPQMQEEITNLEE